MVATRGSVHGSTWSIDTRIERRVPNVNNVDYCHGAPSFFHFLKSFHLKCAKRRTHGLNAMAKHYQMNSKYPLHFATYMLKAFSFPFLSLLGLFMQGTLRGIRHTCIGNFLVGTCKIKH